MRGGVEPDCLLSGRRMLVADDDGDFADFVAGLLVRLGAARVEVASCGVEALEALAADPGVDLVLTDHRMPTPNGAQLLAMARTAGCRQPFLIVTAFPDDDLIASVSDLERADVLGKPFTPSELARAAARLIARD